MDFVLALWAAMVVVALLFFRGASIASGNQDDEDYNNPNFDL